MHIAKKLRRQGGFSLAELLITIIIVSLMSVLTVVGINAAYRTYTEVTDAANARTALSTAAEEIRNELSFAGNIKLFADKGITYEVLSGAGFGRQNRILIDEDHGLVKEEKYDSLTRRYEKTRTLLPQTVTYGKIKITCDSISLSDDCVIFHGLRATGSEENTVISIDEFTVRTVSGK